jgi:pheromone shutdown protein TraB
MKQEKAIMKAQKLNDLLTILPIEKYNDVIEFIEFIISREEPELLLEETDELRYSELLKSSERLDSDEAERLLLGEG